MKILHEEPLARHGYWGVGGPIERLLLVDSVAELSGLGRPIEVIGNGSNLLVPDAGLRGTVVRLVGLKGSEILEDGDRVLVRAEAGLMNSVLLTRLAKLGVGGLGCLAGVPGTVGGAVAMNAGTALGEVADVLVEVDGLTPEGPRRIPRADLPMRYREGGLPAGFVVTSAKIGRAHVLTPVTL